MDYRYRASNHNRWVNNADFIRTVVDQTAGRLERRLTSGEHQFVTNFVRQLDPRQIAGKPLPSVARALSDVLSQKLKSFVCEPEEIDTHEVLKGQIGISTEQASYQSGGQQVSFSNPVDIIRILGQATPEGIQKYFNPQALCSRNYFVLDTRYRVLDNDGTRTFIWDHVNNLSRAQGTVNTVGNIRDIIQIKVYPIRIPYAAGADNDHHRVTALFDEFSAQSFVGQENRRFHTVFEAKVDGDFIDLDSRYQNEGIYRFSKPITQFNSITLSFASPLEPITFDTDRLSSTLTHAAVTIITTSANHNLSSGNRVYISSYSTTNAVQDTALIASVNSSHLVTVTGATTFTIPIDTSSINAALTGTVAVVNGTPNVVGTATAFTTEINVGDTIRIVDSGLVSRTYVVLSITDDTNLTLVANYEGITEGGLNAFRDNRITGLSFTTFFDSKRFFVPIEVTYLTPAD
jgi:hypothetical protein